MMLAGVLVLAACHKKEAVEIPVTKIEIELESTGLFVGDETTVLVKCYPENATNLELLTVGNSNSNVATFENGKLRAKAVGTTTLTARCGNAFVSQRVTVYSGYFTKGGTKYGVDKASGYYYLYGQSQPQEMEIKLTHLLPNNDTQNFKIWIKCSNLGKEMDITQGLDEGQVSVYKNQNEDGYCLPYDSEGKPVVVLADWGYTDATLTKGLLTVTDLGGGNFKIEADFALSNGYTFTASWEGAPAMQKEG